MVLRRRGTLIWCLLLFAWSLIPLASLVLQVLRSGGVLSGADGMLAGSDQQLYLANIRDAGSDVLISNKYRLGDSHGVFLHPMWLLSGLLWRLGVDLRLTLWLWKPVAGDGARHGRVALRRALPRGPRALSLCCSGCSSSRPCSRCSCGRTCGSRTSTT